MPTTFPYIAYTSSADVFLRSGPGQRYYPTSKLPAGFAVEVYRHDQSGWCAVRPPEGSFSWIAAHQVRQSGGNIAEVVADRAVARIGSHMSPERSAVQVMLPRGEQVEIFAPQAGDDVRWLRIAAPAGEFRWIAASDLSHQPPIEARLPKENRTATVTTDIEVVAGSPAELQLAEFARASEVIAPSLFPPQKESLSVQALGLRGETLAEMPSDAPHFRVLRSNALSASQSQQVELLELRLAQMVVEPPPTWQFDGLVAEVENLLADVHSPAVRAQVREVRRRIENFRQVQQRYLETPPVETLASDEQTTATATSADVDHVSKESDFTDRTSVVRQRMEEDLRREELVMEKKPKYDAVGRLKPVVSKRKNAPQFALVDDRGGVVSFVTPTPNLDLSSLVGRRIGVHGKRGFMPEFRRAHVTASRVTPVDGKRRR